MGLNRLFMVKHVESGAVDENVFIMTMGTIKVVNMDITPTVVTMVKLQAMLHMTVEPLLLLC